MDLKEHAQLTDIIPPTHFFPFLMTSVTLLCSVLQSHDEQLTHLAVQKEGKTII